MDDFQICLFPAAGGLVVPIVELVTRPPDQRGPNDYSYDSVALRLLVGGVKHHMGFGPLRNLVPQLEPTRDRLAAGLPSLMRTGLLDCAEGVYLLLEPMTARIALHPLIVEQLPEAFMPNLPADTAEARQLYEFVARERASLIEAGSKSYKFPELVLPSDVLLAAFGREAAVGRTLLADLGDAEELLTG